jgi:hypothetical protein
MVMTGNKGKINVLCENYDDMTDEGKNKLLKIGEQYLHERISFKAEIPPTTPAAGSMLPPAVRLPRQAALLPVIAAIR